MKKILLLPFIMLAMACAVIGCKKTPIYHIRVDCFLDGEYTVKYTNDDWHSEKNINATFDISHRLYPNGVCYQEVILDKAEAISLAKGLTSFNLCEAYNLSIWNKYQVLLRYRKAHPIKPETEEKTLSTCCKTINIY